jgi:hypothetical protein
MTTHTGNQIREAASAYGHLNEGALQEEALRRQAPAVFATQPSDKTGRRYTFIPTGRVVAGLMDAGFVPVSARQTRSRGGVEHARHVVRLRRRLETVQLKDAVPEIVLLNSHDGTSAYQLRVGLFRLVCLNGLLVAIGSIATVRVPHRGDVVDDVVTGALTLSERFGEVGGLVERMERRVLTEDERYALARQALALRFEPDQREGLSTAEALQPRRAEDAGSDLWRTYNVLQESVVRGGLVRRLPSGRLTRTRGIRAIREDVRLNAGLWGLASSYLEPMAG